MAEFRFIPGNAGVTIGTKQFLGFPPDSGSQPAVSTSIFGLPVISNLVIQAGSYVKDGETTNYEGIQMDTILMSINQVKNVVRTPVAGKNGTVKEYISDGDYTISVQGAIVSDDNDTYPSDGVKTLIEILQSPEPLQFSSRFIDQFGAFELVVTDYDFPEVEGNQNQQPFQINFISDNPIELELNEEARL